MTETNKTFILVDTSYWIFYRYFALLQWWNHAKPDNPLGEDPYKNEEFVEKFIKTFTESLDGFKKKQKLHKQRGKPETPCTIIACRDCPRKEIWRNSFIDLEVKETTNAFSDIDAFPIIKKDIVVITSAIGKLFAVNKKTGCYF